MAELQVVIPYLSTLWCLQDCILSFGASTVPVMIVDNSPDGDAVGSNWPSNVAVVHRNGINIGISASWNLGLDIGADQTLLMSQTVRLAPKAGTPDPIKEP